MERKIALVKALSKVIWIQNDLFAKWYVRDGEEFVGREDDGERMVPELGGEIEEAGMGGSCPFRNLVGKGAQGRSPLGKEVEVEGEGEEEGGRGGGSHVLSYGKAAPEMHLGVSQAPHVSVAGGA